MKMILLIIVSLKTALRSARPLECKAAVLHRGMARPQPRLAPAGEPCKLIYIVSKLIYAAKSARPARGEMRAPRPPAQIEKNDRHPNRRGGRACGRAGRSGPRARQFDFASRQFTVGFDFTRT
jgi:hypothetical protein